MQEIHIFSSSKVRLFARVAIFGKFFLLPVFAPGVDCEQSLILAMAFCEAGGKRARVKFRGDTKRGERQKLALPATSNFTLQFETSQSQFVG